MSEGLLPMVCCRAIQEEPLLGSKTASLLLYVVFAQ